MSETVLRNVIPSAMNPPLNTILVTDDAGLNLVDNYLQRVNLFGFDTETNFVDDFTNRRLRTIQVGDRNEQYVIDLLALAGSTDLLISSQGFGCPNGADGVFSRLVAILRPPLESSEKLKIGTGLQFDYEVLRWCLGLRMTGMHDLQRAEQNIYAGVVPTMFSGVNFWGLENIVGRYLGITISKDEQSGFDLETPLTQNQITYCGLDVRLPVACYGAQLKLIQREKLERAVSIDCDAISAFGDMHLNGMLCSPEKWNARIETNLAQRATLVKAMDAHMLQAVGPKEVTPEELQQRDDLEKIWRDAPQKTPEDKAARKEARKRFMVANSAITKKYHDNKTFSGDAAINYGSTKQLAAAIRQHLNLTTAQLPDTNDGTLERLCKHKNLTVEDAFSSWGSFEYGIIDLLRLYRTVDKQLTTYGTVWITPSTQGGLVNPVTGRLHPKINLFGADTGRTTSSGPNSQNLPRSKVFRHCFIARPGYKIVTIDMSGAELRIMAEMSGDPVMLEAFKNGWDVHSVGAEILFQDEWTANTKPGCKYYETHAGRDHQKCKCPAHEELRNKVKAVNFGIVYGKSYFGLAADLNIPPREAKELLAKYKATFPVLMIWLEERKNLAQHHQIVYSMEGGRRRWRKPEWEDVKKKLNEEMLKKYKRLATSEEIRRKYVGRFAAIGREGMNAGVQRTNSYMAKRAMYLMWLQLELRFGAFFYNFVHDEVVVEVPEENAEECARFLEQCFLDSGREFFKTIDMTSEYHIEDCWTK